MCAHPSLQQGDSIYIHLRRDELVESSPVTLRHTLRAGMVEQCESDWARRQDGSLGWCKIRWKRANHRKPIPSGNAQSS